MSAMPPLDWANDPVDVLRAGYIAERLAILGECPEDVVISECEFATGTGLRFDPKTVTGETDILYFHGGGWIVGSPWTHRTLCSWLAKTSGRRVFAAPYGLAPEHKFPSQAHDASAVLDQFSAGRENVILAGDSAGGAMVMWAAGGAKSSGKIKALISLYGAFCCLGYVPSQEQPVWPDALHEESLKSMYRHLGCEDAGAFQDALSKSGAPLLLVRAECDSIASDNFWLAENVTHPVTHMLAKDQPHAYLQFAGSSAAVRDSMREIASWINTTVDS